MEDTNRPLDAATLACEDIVTSLAVASQMLEVERQAPDDPLTPRAITMLLEAYAISCASAGNIAEA